MRLKTFFTKTNIKATLFAACFLSINASVVAAPKLVVQIVVSGMRYDYLERFGSNFTNDGFKSFYTDGVVYKNAHYGYMLTTTEAGLATISTGIKRLTKEREKRLTDLGIAWSGYSSWEDKYAIAKQFYERYGHLNVPGKYVTDGLWINKWLNEQKQIYRGNRKGKYLTQEQIELLESLDIKWSKNTASLNFDFQKNDINLLNIREM